MSVLADQGRVGGVREVEDGTHMPDCPHACAGVAHRGLKVGVRDGQARGLVYDDAGAVARAVEIALQRLRRLYRFGTGDPESTALHDGGGLGSQENPGCCEHDQPPGEHRPAVTEHGPPESCEGVHQAATRNVFCSTRTSAAIMTMIRNRLSIRLATKRRARGSGPREPSNDGSESSVARGA